MVMEKKVLLGVRRKESIKRIKKKSFLKKVVDYLKSDCYMFAPLISSPQPDVSVQKTAATGVKREKPMKKKRKRLMKEVLEYSKSDGYMYGYLMVPHSSDGVLGTKIMSPCTTGPITSIPTRTSKKSNQQTKQSENVTLKNPPLRDCSELVIASEQIIGHRETVKPLGYQTCRSQSISGDRMMELPAMKSIVE